jgi:hypothetical protein
MKNSGDRVGWGYGHGSCRHANIAYVARSYTVVNAAYMANLTSTKDPLHTRLSGRRTSSTKSLMKYRMQKQHP